MLNRKNKVIIFKLTLLGIIGFAGIQGYFYQKSILENPFKTKATIIGFKNCYRNSQCIKYSYEYRGKVYKDIANSTLEFVTWCDKRENCTGLKFDIILNSQKPSENMANWEEIFKEKIFTN